LQVVFFGNLRLPISSIDFEAGWGYKCKRCFLFMNGVAMRKCLIFFSICFLAAGLARAERSLTLEECVEIGLSRSTVLMNAERDELIAESKVRQVRAQVFPQLDAEAGYTRLDEVNEIEGADITFGRLDNYNAGLTASQLLYSGGSVSAALNAAKDYVDVTSFGREGQRNLVVRDVTASFYEILYARTRVDVSRQSVEQLEKFEDEAHSKYKNEVISEFDWLSAKVKLANERPKLVRDRNALAIQKASFAKLLQLNDDEFRLEGVLEYEPLDFELSRLIKLGLKERPDLRASESRTRLREADVAVAKGNYMPDLNARGSYQGTNPDQQSFAAENEWGWHWEVGLDLSWAILDGGLRRARTMEKRLAEDKAKADYADLRRQVKLEIRQAYLTLRHALEVVESSDEAVALAQKAYDIAEVRYSKGLSTYLEFTDSNLALSQAKLNKAQSITRYLQALADLRLACGVDRLAEAKGNE